MAKLWTVKEDLITCKFVCDNQDRYLNAELLYTLRDKLCEAGFEERSITALNKRAGQYQSLFRGDEAPYATEQMRAVYQSFAIRDNENLIGSIRSCIAETFDFNASTEENVIDRNSVLAHLSGEGNGLTSYACSVDMHETFPMVLERFIEKKGFRKHKEIYSKIFMKADTFSSILRGKYPIVKKENVLRLCVGLQLSVDEAEEFMESAGYLFSRGIMMDVVIKTCLAHQCYNTFMIDEELYEHNAPALFGVV